MVQYGLRKGMEKTIEAVYENGVFRPKRPVELDEKTEVRLRIEGMVETPDGEDDPTGWNAARRFIGFIKDEPAGLPVARDHDKYLDE
jgi:hypothetical protein